MFIGKQIDILGYIVAASRICVQILNQSVYIQILNQSVCKQMDNALLQMQKILHSTQKRCVNEVAVGQNITSIWQVQMSIKKKRATFGAS